MCHGGGWHWIGSIRNYRIWICWRKEEGIPAGRNKGLRCHQANRCGAGIGWGWLTSAQGSLLQVWRELHVWKRYRSHPSHAWTPCSQNAVWMGLHRLVKFASCFWCRYLSFSDQLVFVRVPRRNRNPRISLRIHLWLSLSLCLYLYLSRKICIIGRH